MKHILIVTILLNVLGVHCGTAPTNDNFTASTPELTSITTEFKIYKDQYQPAMSMNNVNISFGEMTGLGITANTIAFCNPRSISIVIRADYWYKVSPRNRRVILFHELGHCVLMRSHTSSTVFDPNHLSTLMPKSIMNPTPEIVLPYIDDNESYYVRELFNNPNS